MLAIGNRAQKPSSEPDPTIVFKLASVTDTRLEKELSKSSSDETVLLKGSDGVCAAQDVITTEIQSIKNIAVFLYDIEMKSPVTLV